MRINALAIMLLAGVLLLSGIPLIGSGAAEPEASDFPQPDWSLPGDGDSPFLGLMDPDAVWRSVPPISLGSYSPHEDFDIYDDVEFMERATNESWPGSGTPEDPFLIQGYEFSLPNDTSAIRIRDVTYHFTIRDCYMHSNDSVTYFDVAVYLINVQGASVENLVTRNSKAAIAMEECSNITISGCDIGDLADAPGMVLEEVEHLNVLDCRVVGGVMGIYLEGSSDVLISACNFTDSEFPAIWLSEVGSLTIDGCAATDTVLFLPYEKEELDAVTLIGNNTVNGLPLLVLKDTDLQGGTVTSGYGQYLLFNVTNGRLQGIRMPHSNYQMVITECSHLTIQDVVLTAEKIPIVMLYCEDCVLRDVEVSAGNMGAGYYICYLEGCRMLNCTAMFFAEGIRAEGIHDCLISGCNLSFDLFGIRFFFSCCDNCVVGCTFFRNLVMAVEIEAGSDGNSLLSNTFMLNGDQSDDPEAPWEPQCCDNGTGNLWNSSGSPHGWGNYWYGFDSPVQDGIYQNPVPIIVSLENRTESNHDHFGYDFAPGLPGAPTNPRGEVDRERATLTWSAPTSMGGSMMSGYAIYRASASTGWVEVARVTGLQYQDVNVTADTYYLYKVSAINLMGEGVASDEVLVFVPGPEDQALLWFAAIMTIVVVFLAIFAVTLWKRD